MKLWKRTTKEDYWYGLECLPPAVMTGLGFLVGEPSDHETCTKTGKVAPRFPAFAELNGKYFKCKKPLTVAEFQATTSADVLNGGTLA